MTITTTKPIIIAKDDYDVLTSYIKSSRPPGSVHEKAGGKSLSEELENANVVDTEKIPADVIRLNDTVLIRDLSGKRELKVTIVMPQHADVKQNRISVLAPLGTALIGYRKGQKISWDMPAGTRTFEILDVKRTKKG